MTRCSSGYTGCTKVPVPGMKTCQACRDEYKRRAGKNWEYSNPTNRSCAIPFCNELRCGSGTYCRTHYRLNAAGYKVPEIRADVRGELISMLRSMERRTGWTHPGVVYAWTFEKANIVKWGHSVTTAADRREYACLGVYKATGIVEVPTLELEVEAAEPASLERFVIEHLPAPVYGREFFSLEHLPTIKRLVYA